MKTINNKIMSKKKISIQTVVEYIVAALIVLDGNSVYRHNIIHNYHFAFLSGIAILILYLIVGEGKIEKRKTLWAIIIEIWTGIYLLFSYSTIDLENFISLFMIGVPATFLLASMYNKKGEPFRLLYRIETVVLFLAVISVILWLCGSVLGILQHSCSIQVNWGREKTIYGYFGVQYETAIDTTFGLKGYRNSGIFTEAPMFNLWLCFALAIELFLKDKTILKKVIILVVAILTTISSTGFVVATLCFLMKYWQTIKQMKKQIKIMMLVSLAVGVPFVIYYAVKLFQVKSDTLSFAIRLQDYSAGVIVWEQHPLFGSGFGNLAHLYNYTYTYMQGLESMGYSNSVMGLLATGGIWMFLLYVLGILGLLRKKKVKGYDVRAFGFCYLALFVLTIFFARFISAFFLGIGLSLLSYWNFDVKWEEKCYE